MRIYFGVTRESRKWALTACLMIFIALGFGCTPKIYTRKTYEMTAERFGNQTKAEFYLIQARPNLSGGAYVPFRNSSTVMYVVRTPFLRSADIASVKVVDSAPGSAHKKVELTLAREGQAKVQRVIADTSVDEPMVLIWQNEIYAKYSARVLTNAPAIVFDDLDEDSAKSLASALR
jgi:hypothetical protein